MEIHVRDDSKIVEVWLTNAEKNDPTVKASLKPLYEKYKGSKYLVAVFQSGGLDLREETSALLVHNRRKLAERDVMQGQAM